MLQSGRHQIPTSPALAAKRTTRPLPCRKYSHRTSSHGALSTTLLAVRRCAPPHGAPRPRCERGRGVVTSASSVVHPAFPVFRSQPLSNTPNAHQFRAKNSSRTARNGKKRQRQHHQPPSLKLSAAPASSVSSIVQRPHPGSKSKLCLAARVLPISPTSSDGGPAPRMEYNTKAHNRWSSPTCTVSAS